MAGHRVMNAVQTGSPSPEDFRLDGAEDILIDDGRDLAGGDICTETFPPCHQFTIQGEAFSPAVREGAGVPVPLTDAIKNIAVIEAMICSGQSGKCETP